MKHILRRNLLALSFILIAVSGMQSTRGQVAQRADLILTENSPTSLSLSYTGGATPQSAFNVTPGLGDQWTITVSHQLGPISFNDFAMGWTEPESPLFVNEVTHFAPAEGAPDQIFVHSDLSVLFNTTTTLDNTAFLVGTDSAGIEVFLTFHDVAATSEASVPDTGSTLGLLALSSVALLGVSRVRSLRSA